MIFEELDELFESATIKPTFEIVHVLLALFIFGENREGIGRYRLQKSLSLGAGTAKSLIKKLNKNVGFITVLSIENKRKGHVLTERGIEFLKKASNRLSNGIDQRDAAIKIGGIGATCLIFARKKLVFPAQKTNRNIEDQSIVDKNIFEYIQIQVGRKNFQLEENDVIIIGIGKDPQKARLATLNAALTLV